MINRFTTMGPVIIGLMTFLYSTLIAQQVTQSGSNCAGNSTGFEISVSQPQCKLSNGSAHVNVVTNPLVGSIVYQWSTGPVTVGWTGASMGIYNLAPGTYSVTGTDFRGCWTSYNIQVDADTATYGMFTQQVAPTCTAHSGSIEVDPHNYDQFGPFTYRWSNGQQGYKDTMLGPGTYTVVVTDSPGCHGYFTATLTPYMDQIAWDYNALDEEYCHMANGSYTYGLLLSGTAPVTYQWSDGKTTQYYDSNLVAGTYYASMTDAYGCKKIDTIVIPESSDSIIAFVTTTPTGCVPMGTATASYSSFYTIYNFEWSNGSTNQNLTNLNAGEYSFTVTDATGCEATASGNVIIATNTHIQPNMSITVANCTGGGSAVSNTTGGTPPYTYLWSNGSYYSSISSASGGRYSLRITDTWGCHVDTSFTIPDTGTTLKVTAVGHDGLCKNDAWAVAEISGGFEPYSLSWSDGQLTDTAIQLNGGLYYAEVTDSEGCVAVASVIITQYSSDSVSARVQVTPAYCGNSNGTATATPVTGYGPFYFAWSNGYVDTAGFYSDIENLATGIYNVTVFDENGCSATASGFVPDSVYRFQLDILVTPIVCDKPGLIQCTPVDGGVPSFHYQWQGIGNEYQGALSGYLSVNYPGTFGVTVRDTNGCVAYTRFYVSVADSNLRLVTQSIPDTCLGGKGQASVTVAGGTPPYEYEWNDNSTAASITHLYSDIYTVYVFDANGCFGETDIIVDQFDLALDLNITTHAAICDRDTGNASVVVTDGSAPYTYDWSTGQTTPTINNLAPGSYELTVTDDDGCYGTGTAIIADNTANINPGITTVSAGCNLSNGAATSTPLGGVVPYSYNWSNGAVTATINNLNAGAYALTVTDDNGCTAIGTAWVGTNSLTDSIKIRKPVCTASNGSATVVASGGATPYSFTWSNGSHADSIGAIAAGHYAVTITDNNGCKIVDSIFVQPTPGTLGDSLSVYNALCGGHNGAVLAKGSGGSFPYSFRWNNNQTTAYIDSLAAGNYTVTVTDASGCTVQAAASVRSVSRALILTPTSSNPICSAQNGFAGVHVNGAVAPIRYNWSNNATTAAIANLAPGLYHITVTDTLGCTAVASITLTAIAGNVSVSLHATNAVCTSHTGAVSVSASGGAIPYNYRWSSGDSVNPIKQQLAGPYTVTVSDQNGCSSSASVTITSVAVPIAIAFTTQYPICHDSSGAITSTPNGGNGPYTYFWNNGATTASISNLRSGYYEVIVTDSSGCSAVATDTLPQNSGAVVASALTTTSACGQATGQAIAWVVGGHQPFAYIWSTTPTQTGDTATGLAAGNYVLTVTDSKGCSATGSAGISNNGGSALSLSSTPANGGNNGTATVTVTGTGNFTYSWNNGGTSAVITGLAPGTYYVTVTNAGNCESVGSITVANITGVQAISASIACNLYPNPSTGQVFVDLQLPQTTNFVIEWYNLLGERLLVDPITNVQNMKKEYDLSQYAVGTYIMRIIANGVTLHKTVVITR